MIAMGILLYGRNVKKGLKYILNINLYQISICVVNRNAIIKLELF